MLLKFKEEGKTIDLTDFGSNNFSRMMSLKQKSISPKKMYTRGSRDARPRYRKNDKSQNFEGKTHKTIDQRESSYYDNSKEEIDDYSRIIQETKNFFMINDPPVNPNETKSKKKKAYKEIIKELSHKAELEYNKKLLAKSKMEKINTFVNSNIIDQRNIYQNKNLQQKSLEYNSIKANGLNEYKTGNLFYDRSKRSKTSKAIKRFYTKITPSEQVTIPKDEEVSNFKKLFKKGNEYLNYFWQSIHASTNSKMSLAINKGKISSAGYYKTRQLKKMDEQRNNYNDGSIESESIVSGKTPNKRQKSSGMIGQCFDGRHLIHQNNDPSLNPQTVEEEPSNKSSDEVHDSSRNCSNEPKLITKNKAIFQVYKNKTEESLITKCLDEMAEEPINQVQKLYSDIVRSKRKLFLRRFRILNEKISIYTNI